VDVPIQADDAPNVFVTVNAWQALRAFTETEGYNWYQSRPDAQLYVATVELQVPVTDKRLTVTLTPDKPTYGPRESATFAVRVTDALSRPVQAEVSLALVDEAIFALSEELSGPLHETFYAPRQHIVRTYDALALLRELFMDGRAAEEEKATWPKIPAATSPTRRPGSPPCAPTGRLAHRHPRTAGFAHQLAADGQSRHDRHASRRSEAQHHHPAGRCRASHPAAHPHRRR
jgi:hypothetical protein